MFFYKSKYPDIKILITIQVYFWNIYLHRPPHNLLTVSENNSGAEKQSQEALYGLTVSAIRTA